MTELKTVLNIHLWKNMDMYTDGKPLGYNKVSKALINLYHNLVLAIV